MPMKPSKWTVLARKNKIKDMTFYSRVLRGMDPEEAATTPVIKSGRKRTLIGDELEYAIYKGDEFVFTGNPKECMEFLNVSVNTFRYYLSNNYRERVEARKKTRKGAIYIVSLNDEEDEEENELNISL